METQNLFINFTNTDPKDVKSLAIGGFDGMHVAHRKLFSKLGKNGAILAIEKRIMRLSPKRTRELFCEHPIFYLDLKKVKHISAKEFVGILEGVFTNLETIVVGYDFRFGKNRTSDASFLQSYFKGKVTIVKEVVIDSLSVHARDIIGLIENGKIEAANKYLCRPYMLQGVVIKGNGLGSRELFATINIEVKDFAIPKAGVYVGQTKIQETLHKSVIFVGHRLSTDGNFAIETHIIDEKIENFNEKTIQIYFIARLRDNKKFDSLQDLKAQISKDLKKARAMLG